MILSSALREHLLPYLAHPSVADFVKHGFDVTSRVPPHFPYFNYFAFNFLDDEIYNLKLYFTYYHPIHDSDAAKFLPDLSDYRKYIAHWQPFRFRDANNSGCSFAIKINKNSERTHQFHFRFPFQSRILPTPRFIALQQQDLSLFHGISHEYTGPENLEKLYYYLAPSSPTTHQLLREYNEPFLGQMLEYTEMNNSSKIIHWFRSRRRCKEYLSLLPQNSTYIRTIDQIESELGVTAMFPGIYRNGRMRSIYFLKTPSSDDALFETIENQMMDTLGPWLRPLLRSGEMR